MFSRILLLFFLIIINSHAINAQQNTRTVSGIVTTEESAPLEGVAVSVKGTPKISGSQADGIFYITLSDKDTILVFSYQEYQTQEVKLNASNEYNVVLRKKSPTVNDKYFVQKNQSNISRKNKNIFPKTD